MSAIALRLVVRLVRLWTAAVTAGLPAAARDRRREEIASDLWEFHQDPSRGGDLASALRVAARLLVGIPDDIIWRIGQQLANGQEGLMMERLTAWWPRLAIRAAVVLAISTLIAIVLAGQALRPATLPPVAPAPPLEILRLHVRTPPVPPPPPPLRRDGVREPDWAGLLREIHLARRQSAMEAMR